MESPEATTYKAAVEAENAAIAAVRLTRNALADATNAAESANAALAACQTRTSVASADLLAAALAGTVADAL